MLHLLWRAVPQCSVHKSQPLESKASRSSSDRGFFLLLLLLLLLRSICHAESSGRLPWRSRQCAAGTPPDPTASPAGAKEAMNSISRWANEWLVTINRSKTDTICFSLSRKREKYSLEIVSGFMSSPDERLSTGQKPAQQEKPFHKTVAACEEGT